MMNVNDYFVAGNELPLLTPLLRTVDDPEIFPTAAADTIDKPAEFVTSEDGRIVLKSPPITRKATAEECAAFQERCRTAMRDLVRFALFCWTEDMGPQFASLARSVEVGTALIDRHESIFYPHDFPVRKAILTTARRSNLVEDDAAAFLYFMLGVFAASREEWYWAKQKKRTGQEKPWQQM